MRDKMVRLLLVLKPLLPDVLQELCLQIGAFQVYLSQTVQQIYEESSIWYLSNMETLLLAYP